MISSKRSVEFFPSLHDEQNIFKVQLLPNNSCWFRCYTLGLMSGNNFKCDRLECNMQCVWTDSRGRSQVVFRSKLNGVTVTLQCARTLIAGSLRNVFGPTNANAHSLFTQYPERPGSANDYFRYSYSCTHQQLLSCSSLSFFSMPLIVVAAQTVLFCPCLCRDGYAPTLYDFSSDFSEAERDACRPSGGAEPSYECLHDSRASAGDAVVRQDTLSLVETLRQDKERLGTFQLHKQKGWR